MRSLVPLGLGLAVVLASPSAEAAGDNHIAGARFELHANVNPYALGAGFRVELPIVPNGVIQGGGSVTDEIAVTLGADMFFASYGSYNNGVYLTPLATLEWNFYLGDKWSIFPEVGIAFPIGFNGPDYDYSYWGGPRDRRGYYVWYTAGFGVRYHFSERNSLVFRFGSTSGFAIGITF